jgi:pilus assembly protein Flp/PilA
VVKAFHWHHPLSVQFVLGKSGTYQSGKEVKDMLFAPKEKGQGLVEYALILVLVAVVVIAVLTLLGPIIGNVFSDIIAGLGG